MNFRANCIRRVDALAQQILFENYIIDYTILFTSGTMFHAAKMSSEQHLEQRCIVDAQSNK